MRLTAFLILTLTVAAQQPKEPPKAVTLPTSAGDIAQGEKLYRGSCQYCHGPQGDGGKGANLARPKLDRATTDEKLVNVIENGIPGTEMPGAWHMIEKEWTQVAAFVRTLGRIDQQPVPGNPGRGKAIYAKSGCDSCHSLNAPDLKAIGSRRAAAYLRESLLDPNASVPENYLYVTVIPTAGAPVTGNRLAEDTFTILIRDLGGANRAFQKAALKDIRKEPKKSAMPSFKGKFSPAELDDLISHLVSLKEPS